MSDYKELLGQAATFAKVDHASMAMVRDLSRALRTVIAERDDLEAQIESAAYKYGTTLASFEARAEQAEVRLAEFTRWQGDAEKVAVEIVGDFMKILQTDQLIPLIVPALTSFAAQAAARQREKDAKIADERGVNHAGDGISDHWATKEARAIAAAIRKGET